MRTSGGDLCGGSPWVGGDTLHNMLSPRGCLPIAAKLGGPPGVHKAVTWMQPPLMAPALPLQPHPPLCLSERLFKELLQTKGQFSPEENSGRPSRRLQSSQFSNKFSFSFQRGDAGFSPDTGAALGLQRAGEAALTSPRIWADKED